VCGHGADDRRVSLAGTTAMVGRGCGDRHYRSEHWRIVANRGGDQSSPRGLALGAGHRGGVRLDRWRVQRRPPRPHRDQPRRCPRSSGVHVLRLCRLRPDRDARRRSQGTRNHHREGNSSRTPRSPRHLSDRRRHHLRLSRRSNARLGRRSAGSLTSTRNARCRCERSSPWPQ